MRASTRRTVDDTLADLKLELVGLDRSIHALEMLAKLQKIDSSKSGREAEPTGSARFPERKAS